MNRDREQRVSQVMRCASAVLALYLVAAQLASQAHVAAVSHRICEHGAVVHGKADSGSPNALLPKAPAHGHHDGCSFVALGQAHSESAAWSATTIAASTQACSVRRFVVRPLPVLALAPARSPPMFLG